MDRFIALHREAPSKPPLGAPCNGCGVCCAAEPCPVGIVVSRRRQGRCTALQWEANQYRCGLVVAPQDYLPAFARRLAPWLRRLALRCIAADKGCDATITIAD